jgi:hypothetical protein
VDVNAPDRAQSRERLKVSAWRHDLRRGRDLARWYHDCPAVISDLIVVGYEDSQAIIGLAQRGRSPQIGMSYHHRQRWQRPRCRSYRIRERREMTVES